VNEARFEMFAGSNAGMMPFNQEKQRSWKELQNQRSVTDIRGRIYNSIDGDINVQQMLKHELINLMISGRSR
jgi:hypothetical protein